MTMKPTFDEIFNRIIENTTDGSAEKLNSAYELLIANKNKIPDRFNKKGFENTLEIAKIAVTEIGLGQIAICATLLKELYEEKIIADGFIIENFGKEVLKIISGLIKINEFDTIKVFEKKIEVKKVEDDTETESGSKRTKVRRQMSFEKKLLLQSENFSKMLLAIIEDVRVILLQFAIRINTLRNIDAIEQDKRIGITRESAYLYAPMAHKLGLYSIKTEMEEVSMKFNHPDMYRFIANKLDESKTDRNNFIESFIAPIKDKLSANKIKCEIKGRPKSIHSIWRKMLNQEVEFEGIYDLFAIRIILDDNYENVSDEKSACWAVYSMVTDFYTPNPKRLRDWISAPKSSGYESLHTTVMIKDKNDIRWVEVQIRTRRMDDIAEKGHAAHWKYKEIKGSSQDSRLNQIRTLLETGDEKNLSESSKAKTDLYADNIFVFTPKGELRTLQKDATVLDFAYAIHSGIGDQCVGAKIENRVVPIKHKLKNGDTVEILTSKQQKPREEWLKIVVSQRTKTRIKRALKEELNEQAQIGKSTLTSALSQKNIEITDKVIIKLRQFHGIKSNIIFYAKIGRGEIDINEAIEKNFADHGFNDKDFVEELEKFRKKIEINKSKEYLIIDNLSKLDFEFAKCCSPIPGDEIFGFVSVFKGVKIHKLGCPNAKEMFLRYPYRIVKAKWNQTDFESVFSARIHIKGVNSMTLLSRILSVITYDFHLDLGDTQIKTEKGKMFDGHFTVYVHSKEHLTNLIEKLSGVKGVLSVQRIEY